MNLFHTWMSRISELQRVIYNELANHLGKDNALASILLSLAHELTHYYQWINNIQLTPMGRERQATKYANYIIDEYASTREHP